MPPYKISKKAVQDLLEIGRYTQKIWGIAQRNIYLKNLDDCFSLLSENPSLGIKCDFIASGYRKYPQGSHLIYCRLDSQNSVEIIRILHQCMDVETNF